MLSDQFFFKAELNKKNGLKTSKKGPGAPVIDIYKIPSSKFKSNFVYTSTEDAKVEKIDIVNKGGYICIIQICK